MEEEYFVEDTSAPVAKAAVVAPIAPAMERVSPNGLRHDDLKIVEGIGPKIEGLLKKAGVET